MLEILQYIFSSFWIFCGTVVLIAVIGEVIADILNSIFGGRSEKQTDDIHYDDGTDDRY